MSDPTPLTGPALPPASGGAPKQVVVMLHGVGADGNDLIGLAPFFQQVLPDALFVSPDAPFSYDMAPMGRQWFSIQDFSPEARLKGAQGAAPLVDAFIDTLLTTHDLTEDALVLIGFSQGTMMALHVGLRRPRPAAALIGYSGMLLGPDLLADELVSRPPVLLVHGNADEVLPIPALNAAQESLEAADVSVEAHVRPGLGHGIDEECIRLGMKFIAQHVRNSLPVS